MPSKLAVGAAMAVPARRWTTGSAPVPPRLGIRRICSPSSSPPGRTGAIRASGADVSWCTSWRIVPGPGRALSSAAAGRARPATATAAAEVATATAEATSARRNSGDIERPSGGECGGAVPACILASEGSVFQVHRYSQGSMRGVGYRATERPGAAGRPAVASTPSRSSSPGRTLRGVPAGSCTRRYMPSRRAASTMCGLVLCGEAGDEHEERADGRGCRHEDPALPVGVDRFVTGGRCHDGDEGGDPKRGAYLPEHRGNADGGGDAGGPHGVDGDGREGGDGQADAGAGEELARQERPGVVRREVDEGGVDEEPGGDEEAADGADGGHADAGADAAGERSEGECGQGSGGELGAGAQDAVAPHLGEEQHSGQQEGGEGGEERERRGDREGERGYPQDRELQHGYRVAGGAGERGDGQQGGGGEGGQRAGGRPAPFAALHEGEGQRADAEHEGDGAGEVGQATCPGVAGLLDAAGRVPDGDRTQREVDQEHPPPARLNEQPAQRRPGGGADGAHRCPGGDDRRTALRRGRTATCRRRSRACVRTGRPAARTARAGRRTRPRTR